MTLRETAPHQLKQKIPQAAQLETQANVSYKLPITELLLSACQSC